MSSSCNTKKYTYGDMEVTYGSIFSQYDGIADNVSPFQMQDDISFVPAMKLDYDNVGQFSPNKPIENPFSPDTVCD